ncbi:purine-nucleoside phosphorylase [Arcanobacterium ihumii]|uniref:purine-nucleoside phosphorylase n=1 Tax=Arcanobacterium ihumii TaxID=2138162 RepID=UPI000F534514|nr:purine-nucleoside phosphorylase [Arcanobacterium ihumii]
MNLERYARLQDCYQDPFILRSLQAGSELIEELTGVEQHDAFVVLGSGLTDSILNLGEVRKRIPLAWLPLVREPAAEGHGRELLSIDLDINSHVHHILVSTGRIHLYEGYTPAEISYLAQVAALTGIDRAFLTNAGGCLRDWKLGEVMAISDHVNMSGYSPFTGPAFTDIWELWDPELTTAMKAVTQQNGTYAILRGPEFQTQRESEIMRSNGIDMVGMSTVLEAIALHQLGVRLAGVSVVSDLSFDATPTTHEDVLEAVQGAHSTVLKALNTMLSC